MAIMHWHGKIHTERGQQWIEQCATPRTKWHCYNKKPYRCQCRPRCCCRCGRCVRPAANWLRWLNALVALSRRSFATRAQKLWCFSNLASFAVLEGSWRWAWVSRANQHFRPAHALVCWIRGLCKSLHDLCIPEPLSPMWKPKMFMYKWKEVKRGLDLSMYMIFLMYMTLHSYKQYFVT